MEKIKITSEVAKEVLDFFRQNPNKENCLVFGGGRKEVLYWRKDIPYLEGLLRK